MAVTIDKIELIAPDQASLAAAVKLKPASWPVLGRDGAGCFAWGECQGSGALPYRVAVSIDDMGYKCGCPSRKFPCKHALGLMLMLVKAPRGFADGAVPDWVRDWAGRRKAKDAEAAPAGGKPRLSLAAAADAVEVETGPQAEAHAAMQRERLRAQREAGILDGLDAFDLWLGDLLNRGISAFLADAATFCRTAAQRLTDAKAPGLAARVDALASALLSLPPEERADAAIEALGSWHLLAEAYRRQELLPAMLRHDVRRLMGWTEQRQAVLADATATRARGVWTVIATHSEVQPDKLRRIETWLWGGDGACALLLDFVPAATGAAGSPYRPGECFAGELVFYPSAAPLRALIAAHDGAAAAPSWPQAAGGLARAMDSYDALRRGQPWLGPWPVTFSASAVTRSARGDLWVSDGADAAPLDPRQKDETVALAGIPLTAMTAFWDGRHLTAVAADTQLGRWYRQ